MNYFKQTTKFISGKIAVPWACKTAVVLIFILDNGAIALVIWHLFIRNRVPNYEIPLMLIMTVYLLLVLLMGFISFKYSKSFALQAESLFYLTLGVFISLHTYMSYLGKEFSAWPWVVAIGATILIAMKYIFIEFLFEDEEETAK